MDTIYITLSLYTIKETPNKKLKTLLPKMKRMIKRIAFWKCWISCTRRFIFLTIHRKTTMGAKVGLEWKISIDTKRIINDFKLVQSNLCIHALDVTIIRLIVDYLIDAIAIMYNIHQLCM